MLPELEVCTGDYDSIMAAFLGGATRVEICAALPIGGLTPTAAVMEMTRHVAPAMKRHVLIRPRPGDFLYTDNEFMTMVAEMRSPGIMAADGYVIGILDADGNVDKERTALLMKCVGENIHIKIRNSKLVRLYINRLYGVFYQKIQKLLSALQRTYTESCGKPCGLFIITLSDKQNALFLGNQHKTVIQRKSAQIPQRNRRGNQRCGVLTGNPCRKLFYTAHCLSPSI